MKLYTDKQWLIEQFATPGMTPLRASAIAGCNEKTIRRYMNLYGISTRPIAESAHLRQGNFGLLQSAQLERIEGELLGDGSLSTKSRYSAIYRHSTKHKQYLVWLSKSLGLDFLPIKKTSLGSYRTASGAYAALRAIYDRWYPHGKKELPRDLRLTSLMCLHWYLGDGSLTYKTTCRLSTYGFHVERLTLIMKQLLPFNPRLHSSKSTVKDGYGYRLALDSSFLDFIGPCPAEIRDIYGYKWMWPK